MRYIASLIALSFVLLLPQALYAVPGAPAQPTSVLFYPGEAHLTVQETMKPEEIPGGGRGFMLCIPARADRNTFSAVIDGRPAAGFYWVDEEDIEPREINSFNSNNLPKLPFAGKQRTMDPAQESSDERRAILERLLPLREAVAEKTGAIATIEARMTLLKEGLKPTKEQPLTAEDLEKMDQLLGKTLPGLYADYEKYQRELFNLRKQHDKVQKELEKFDAATKFSLVVIPYNGNPTATAQLKYNYNVPSSYGMDYRLLAYPEKKSLSIEQDATLIQQSGFTWKDVDVFVSTTGRDRMLQPAAPRQWLIVEQPKAPPRPSVSSERSSKDMPSAQMAQAPYNAGGGLEVNVSGTWDSTFGFSENKPEQEQKSTFRLWKLGKQTIAPDSPVRIPMSSDSYEARYYYTLRPGSYFRAFLTAELNLDKPQELALGQARYFVDDVALGQNQFSFNGNKGSIFFGTDPQVTGLMRSVKRSTGEKGFISKEQTIGWNWEIVLNSTRAYPVDVWVEDPAPETIDENFKVEVKSTPKAELATTSRSQGSVKVYRWKLTLKPGEPLTIKHEVQLSAPSDKQVSPGRGEI